MGAPKNKTSTATPVEAEGCENPHLNPALADKYQVVQTHCRYLLNTCVGDVDLSTLTEEQAEALAADETQPYLKKIIV
ncbi:MAG: hypothetical protein V4619_15430 [Bacteroidota bacterium]